MPGKQVRVRYDYGPEDICPKGIFLPLLDERGWNVTIRAIIYFFGMLYLFLGVAIANEIFMTSTEVITSKTKKLYLSQIFKLPKKVERHKDGSRKVGTEDSKNAGPETVEVRVVDITVFKLTLSAISASSSEILLCVIEIIGNQFEHGDLGPGAIVGCAAFNLLVVSSICMVSVPARHTRRVTRLKLCLTVMTFSLLSYIWLFVVVNVTSAQSVEMWEAIASLLLFFMYIIIVWCFNRNWELNAICPSLKKPKMEIEIEPATFAAHQHDVDSGSEIVLYSNGQLDREALVKLMRRIRRFSGLTDEEAAVIAAAKMAEAQPHSPAWYRIGAIRTLSAGRRTVPKLDSRLMQVYEAINETMRRGSGEENVEIPPPDLEKNAIVEFHSAIVAVKENIGQFPVTVMRHGNRKKTVRVRLTTIDGTAKRNVDYQSIDTVLTFKPHQLEYQVMVTIVNNNRGDPNEEFFLRLSLIFNDRENVELGTISVMEITIIEGDSPGVITLERRGLVVMESAGHVTVVVDRLQGTTGAVKVQWRTIDGSAVSGKDFVGGTGQVNFEHGEVRAHFEIPIINRLEAEKDLHFEVELYSPTGGGRLGDINRCAITITNDVDFQSMIDALASMTDVNLNNISATEPSWSNQIRGALQVDAGDVKNARRQDFIFHFFSFFWKVLFSLIPPPTMLGGWLCYFVSLFCLALMTVFIHDFASLFGCLAGLDDTLTAISLVTLGNSIPDALGARSTIMMEKRADSLIIQMSARKTVNVLLGIGVPWFVAVLYHNHNGGDFIMESKDLGFNVILYMACAFIAITILVVRRYVSILGRAEFGGPPAGRWVTATIFMFLWFSYIGITSLHVHGFFNSEL